LEIFGLSLSLVTSFLLVIDNISRLKLHAELIHNSVEILQLAMYHLQNLRHLSLYDSNNPTPALRPRNPKVLAQIFSTGNCSSLTSLHLDIYDFIPEALQNITTSLTDLVCKASHANNFFGQSLEADSENKAIESFKSLENLRLTLKECQIDISSRFLFDEADWPSEKLHQIFPAPEQTFTILFIIKQFQLHLQMSTW
jgi:hypothetical protein